MTHTQSCAAELASHLTLTHGWAILPAHADDLTTLEAMHIIAAERGPCDTRASTAWDVERPARMALSALVNPSLSDAEAVALAVDMAESAAASAAERSRR